MTEGGEDRHLVAEGHHFRLDWFLDASIKASRWLVLVGSGLYSVLLCCSITSYSHLLHQVSRTLDLAHHRPTEGVLHPADQAEPQPLPLCVLRRGGGSESERVARERITDPGSDRNTHHSETNA